MATDRAAQVGFLHEALRAADAGAAESAALLLLSGGMGLAELYDDVVRPFFGEVRTDGEPGALRLVDEHLASRTATELVTLLGRRQTPWTGEHERSGPGRGSVVLGAAPREQHLLGARMLAQVLQSRGWVVHLLDALPFDVLAAYCASLVPRPDVVGLTVQSVPSVQGLRTGLGLLRDALPDVPVVLGGAAVAAAPQLPAKVGATGAVDLRSGVAACEFVTNPLTRREREILGLVAGGASNAQIASALSVHSSTVKTHLEHVADKLGTSDRTAAAVQGVRRGWID
jgi:DNA-binding CsgD family transcriptional regulator